METVKTFEGSIASLEALLEGMIRLALSARNGAVIMKMISNTKARSSSGVIFSSESELSEWRFLAWRMLSLVSPLGLETEVFVLGDGCPPDNAVSGLGVGFRQGSVYQV